MLTLNEKMLTGIPWFIIEHILKDAFGAERQLITDIQVNKM